MFNVKVIKIKDIVKYLIVLAIIIFIIIGAKRYFFNGIVKTQIGFENLLDIELPAIKKVSKQNNQVIDENKEDADIEFFTQMINIQLSAVNFNKGAVSKKEDKQEVNENKETDAQVEKNKKAENKEQEIVLGDIEKDAKSEVVTKNPLQEKYSDKINGVKIKNETQFELNSEITEVKNLNINKKDIIIFHTHTCESYTSSEKYNYTPTGTFRTTDLNYSVSKVGDYLTEYLKQNEFNITHDKTYHDYPAYSGSYTRSLSTVSKILEKNKADIIIDLHRDAIGSNSSYAPTVKIGDDYCAQLMFVIGTNGGGLKHDSWKSNLQFAIKIQEKANELYPGLFKPIILRNSRYNQHLGKAACIIEVGATGNTLDESINSMKYLSEVIQNTLK